MNLFHRIDNTENLSLEGATELMAAHAPDIVGGVQERYSCGGLVTEHRSLSPDEVPKRLKYLIPDGKAQVIHTSRTWRKRAEHELEISTTPEDPRLPGENVKLTYVIKP